VLREALATPAVRELLRLHLGAPGRGGEAGGERGEGGERGGGSGPALVRAVLRADPELWLGLGSAGPALVDEVTQSLVALGREIARLPAPLVDAYLQELAAQIQREPLRELPRVWAPLLGRALPGALDLVFEGVAGSAEALGSLPSAQRSEALGAWSHGMDARRAAAALNAVCELVLTLRRDAPEVTAAAPGVDWEALLAELDFGRLRQAVVHLSSRGRAAAEPLVARVLADPVALANLVGILPALLNDGLGLLQLGLARLDLPDEVLASAVFNLLGALDVGAAARLLGDAARTVDTLHRGSATLGLEEPAFVAVFSELLDDLLDQLDARAVARAVVALGEDADVVARVLARRLAGRPELATLGVQTGMQLADQALQTLLGVIRELEQLDGDTRAVLRLRLRQGDPEAVAALCRRGVELATALWPEGDPPRWGRGLEQALEEPAAQALVFRLVARVARSALREAWHRMAAEPERVGREVTRWLRRFDDAQRQAHPDAARWLSRALGAVQRDELARAVRHTARLAGRALWPPYRIRARAGEERS
jgi:hypothetical protein